MRRIKSIVKSYIEKRRVKAYRKIADVGSNVTLRSSFFIKSLSAFPEIRIGKHCCLNCALYCRGKIKIGDNTYIGRSDIMSLDSIEIGDNVIISDECIIMDNNNHPTSMHMRQMMCESHDFFGPLWKWDNSISNPVVIEDNVWIGKRVIILKGVTVGKGSIVAIGSVVTKDVKPGTIVGGNPAREIKRLTD